MIAYEVLLMFDPELPDDRPGEIVARMRELVEGAGGGWDGHDVWGRRKLAYEIDHKTDGLYHLVTFTCDPATLDELTRVLKITDGVMRHMAVRRVASGRGGGTRPEAPAEAVASSGYRPNGRSEEEE